MNKEIKENDNALINIEEIKDYLKKYYELRPSETKQLLDYITNLEQKYERMKENANILSKGYDELHSRIDKAICYLANCDWNNKEFKEIYDILTGGDEE